MEPATKNPACENQFIIFLSLALMRFLYVESRVTYPISQKIFGNNLLSIAACTVTYKYMGARVPKFKDHTLGKLAPVENKFAQLV